jgi:hypothetical protein
MPVIAICTEPDGATRIFFDCSPVDPDPRDAVRIARVIAQAQPTLLFDPQELPHAELPRAA